MNKYFIFVLIISFIASVCYKKWSINYALKKLYKYRISNRDIEYISALDSFYIKFIFNYFTRQFMKLNYYIDKKNNYKVEEIINTFKNIKMSQNEMIVLYTKLFGYYLENKNYIKAEKIIEKLNPILHRKKDQKSILIMGELEQLERIYIKKDVSLINELEEIIETIEDSNVKSIIYYRLAKLYSYTPYHNCMIDKLKKAKLYAKNIETKESIQKLIDDLLNCSAKIVILKLNCLIKKYVQNSSIIVLQTIYV